MDIHDLKLPQKQKSEQTKQRIFDAMKDLLCNYGYEYVTISNICKAAHVTSGAFYHHYKNKEDIIAFYLNEHYRNYIASHQIAVSERPIERFIDYCVLGSSHGADIGIEFLSHFVSTQNKSMATYGLAPAEMKVSQNYWDRYQCLLQAKEQHLLREDTDLVQLNEDSCSITKGIIFDWCLSDGAFDLESRLRRIITQFLIPYLTPSL